MLRCILYLSHVSNRDPLESIFGFFIHWPKGLRWKIKFDIERAVPGAIPGSNSWNSVWPPRATLNAGRLGSGRGHQSKGFRA